MGAGGAVPTSVTAFAAGFLLLLQPDATAISPTIPKANIFFTGISFHGVLSLNSDVPRRRRSFIALSDAGSKELEKKSVVLRLTLFGGWHGHVLMPVACNIPEPRVRVLTHATPPHILPPIG